MVRAAIAFALLTPLAVVAQDVTAPALKAAFIYNFVRFTTWPAPLPASDPFVICVVGDPSVGNELERLVRGRDVGGHRMLVLPAASPLTNGVCHVVYVSGATANEMKQVVAGLQSAPVLTMSDVAGFIDAGGMAQLSSSAGNCASPSASRPSNAPGWR